MRLKSEKMWRLMTALNWSPQNLADIIKVELAEVYKLIGGEPVNYFTAKAFINYFTAINAVRLINLDEVMLSKRLSRKLKLNKHLSERKLFGIIAMEIKSRAD